MINSTAFTSVHRKTLSNADSTSGVWVNAAVQVEFRRVENLKRQKEEAKNVSRKNAVRSLDVLLKNVQLIPSTLPSAPPVPPSPSPSPSLPTTLPKT